MFAWQCIDLYNTLDKYKSHHAHFDLIIIIITLAEVSKPKKEVTSDFFCSCYTFLTMAQQLHVMIALCIHVDYITSNSASIYSVLKATKK